MKAEILSVMGKTPLNAETIRDKVFSKHDIFYQVDTVSRCLRKYNEVVAIPTPNKHNKGYHNTWRKA